MIIVLIIILILLFVGLILYLEKNYLVLVNKKVMLKEPFKELLNNGFTLKDDFLIGVVNNYTVLVKYKYRPLAIDIQVLYSPDSNAYTFDELKKISKKRQKIFDFPMMWTQYSLLSSISYYRMFKLNTYDNVIKKAINMIDLLVELNLRPINIDKLVNQEIVW